MKILHLVPSFAPQISGVGDYAYYLAAALRRVAGWPSQILVTRFRGDRPPQWQGIPVHQLPQTTAAALVAGLQQLVDSQTGVLLHYVNYGYDAYGCPEWLLQGLARWRQQSQRPLITMFHEVAASGPPWTRTFWLTLQQQQLAARLAHLSDRLYTSRQEYARWLSRLGAKSAIPACPIFANLPEPGCLPPLGQRPAYLAHFGSQTSRRNLYQRFGPAVEWLCRTLGLGGIYDVGQPIPGLGDRLGTLPIYAQGVVSATQLAEILQGARAGVMNYPPRFLAKSTIFAAYASHGLVPIVASYRSAPSLDGLQPGQHYWLLRSWSAALPLDVGNQIAQRAHQRYCRHNQATHAQLVIDLIQNSKG